MKTSLIKKTPAFFLVILTAILFFTACDKNGKNSTAGEDGISSAGQGVTEAVSSQETESAGIESSSEEIISSYFYSSLSEVSEAVASKETSSKTGTTVSEVSKAVESKAEKVSENSESPEAVAEKDEITVDISSEKITSGEFLVVKVAGYTGTKDLFVRFGSVTSKIFGLFKADNCHYGFAPVSSTTENPGAVEIVVKGSKSGSYDVIAKKKVIFEKRSFERQDLTVESGSSMEQAGSSSNLDYDKKLIADATKTSLESLQFTGAFVIPAEGRISTQYGMRRYTNGKYSSAHSGYDIAAPEGNDVLAGGGGRVVFAGEMKFYGNTVIIDHGLNIFSYYNHMSRLNVKTGDDVKTGDLIGFIGTTGYSTGPHLHFNIKVNDVNVNPAVFVDTDFIYTQLERMIYQ